MIGNGSDDKYAPDPGCMQLQVQRRHEMKIGLFLLALVAFAGLTAGYPQYRPAMAKTVAKPAPTSPNFRRGSVGGPANKTGGINGTVRPKY